MKLKIFSTMLCVMCVLLTACSVNPDKESAESFFAMNTFMSISAYGANSGEAVGSARERISELEKMWSVTDEKSELYAINHSGGKTVSVSPETADLISFALEISEQTEGALDPTIYPILTAWGFTTDKNRVPSDTEISEILQNVDYKKVEITGNEIEVGKNMMLDLGAVAKGRAGDQAVSVLKENGVSSALLNLGGNVQLIGSKPDGSDWRIGLKSPDGGGNVGVLNVSDCAVVTSGNYERFFTSENGTTYGHIIDPKIGYPVDNGLLSATVIAESGTLCDALSTSLFVMGLEKAQSFWRKNPNFDMILITESKEIFLTENIADSFSVNENYMDLKTNIIKK